ncbi:MAG: phage GP46 family protein [Actinomycetota bacterium]
MSLLLLDVSVGSVVIVAPGAGPVSRSSATSSAIGLGDIALVWDVGIGSADLTMIDSDIASDMGLVTAVLLSLFVDRRAESDDVPPSGDPSDRRGWWADEFATVERDLIGSRLWLLDRSKLTPDTGRSAETYIREALAWMIEDRVVSAVDVQITIEAQRMLMTVGLQRPGRDRISLRFAQVWDHLTS